MVRPKKYTRKTVPISLTIDPDVLETIKKQAKEHDKTVSEFVTDVLKITAQNDLEYASMMAKKYARKMNFWRGEIQRMEENK